MYKVLVKNAASTPNNLANSGLEDIDFNDWSFDIYIPVNEEAYGHSYALYAQCAHRHTTIGQSKWTIFSLLAKRELIICP